MKFEARHLLAARLEEIETSFVDERYASFLVQYHPSLLDVCLLHSHRQQNRLVRHVRYVPKPVIQSLGPRKVEPLWFSFVAYSTYDFEKKCLYFANEPDNAQVRSMFSNHGTFQFSPRGNQTERFVNGCLSLQLPKYLRLWGPLGEYLIRKEGLKILSDESPVLERFAQMLRHPHTP